MAEQALAAFILLVALKKQKNHTLRAKINKHYLFSDVHAFSWWSPCGRCVRYLTNLVKTISKVVVWLVSRSLRASNHHSFVTAKVPFAAQECATALSWRTLEGRKINIDKD